ncbi:hypothetical protein [Bradyrhizobium sp.]|uniref:hypothetical protein n=1 Tax=Bradyrhizobium sp. TaxID=376 RepID=UPI003C758C85
MIVRFLPILVLLSALLPDCPAQAQRGMLVPGFPSLDVVGFYSLSADREAYARFIQRQIAFHDPANFPDQQRALFRRLGRGDSLNPFTDDDRREWEENFRHHMDDAAVFEVLVKNPDAVFDVGGFLQPDPSQPEGHWQVAWNEKFLSLDGEAVLKPERGRRLPDAEQFRVVFVIHFWKPNLPLRSSYGELALPPVQPLPERLWRLAPYELPD